MRKDWRMPPRTPVPGWGTQRLVPTLPCMAVARTAGWVGTLSGRMGSIVLVETEYGTVVRDRPRGPRGKSALQVESEARLAAASRAFGALTREEGRAWAAYGAELAEAHPRTGRVVGLSAQQAFNRLASKLLQIDPRAALPKAPPAAPFFGDGVRVTVSPSFACERGCRGERGDSRAPDLSTPQPPPLTGVRGGGAGVAFSASSANATGVLTELLLQPLASGHRRTYLERYRTRAFAAFADDARAVTVPCPKGWVAAAVRFVEAATGRTTALVEIGVVLVA